MDAMRSFREFEGKRRGPMGRDYSNARAARKGLVFRRRVRLVTCHSGPATPRESAPLRSPSSTGTAKPSVFPEIPGGLTSEASWLSSEGPFLTCRSFRPSLEAPFLGADPSELRDRSFPLCSTATHLKAGSRNPKREAPGQTSAHALCDAISRGWVRDLSQTISRGRTKDWHFWNMRIASSVLT
jgi:hypothetical protein